MTQIWEKLKGNIAFTWKYDKQFFVKAALLASVFAVVFIMFLADRFGGEYKVTDNAAASVRNNGVLISHEPLHGAVSAGEGATTSAAEGAVTGTYEKNEASPADAPVIYVDVSGAVLNPGVYELAEDSRVFEAAEKAGGLAEDADTSSVNLAARLADGDKLYIPTKDEIKAGKTDAGIITGIIAEKQNKEKASSAGTAKQNDTGSVIININTADAAKLTEISGIGPSTAQKIIDYRTQHGSFKSVTELLIVSGIGEKTHAKIKDKLCV